MSIPLQNEYNKTRTLSGSDFQKAWGLVRQFKCKMAYPYALGREPWLDYILTIDYSEDSIQLKEANKFVEVCNENNIVSEMLYGKKEWII
jgi:hypothetical protein